MVFFGPLIYCLLAVVLGDAALRRQLAAKAKKDADSPDSSAGQVKSGLDSLTLPSQNTSSFAGGDFRVADSFEPSDNYQAEIWGEKEAEGQVSNLEAPETFVGAALPIYERCFDRDFNGQPVTLMPKESSIKNPIKKDYGDLCLPDFNSKAEAEGVFGRYNGG